MRRFFVCLVFLFGCAQTEKGTTRLNLSFNTYPTTTDPRKAADFVSSTLVCMVYEGLTRCVPGGFVEPALAERVEVEDGVLYTFHLRSAFWSDGTPITAFDFERSWKEIIQTASPCTFLFYPIKMAEKCARGQRAVEEVGIWAVDAKTLLVELERPTPYFYSLTAFPSFLPIQEGVYSGPFCIEKRVHNSEILLKKNSRYWNELKMPIDEIHISIVPDEMTALQMFERGDLDWIGGSLSPLPLDAVEKLRDKVQWIPMAASTFCVFNTQRFPFANQNLRRAFSLAIDRNEVVRQQGMQIAACSILPPAFSKQSFELYDPEGAILYLEKGLEELGVERGDFELTLYYKSSQGEKRLAQMLQKQWKELFGITVQLAQLDFKSQAHKLQAKDFQIALASWIAQFEDPASLLDRFKYKDHLKNYAGWESSAYCEKLEALAYNEAETILMDEMPLAPIYHWSAPALCSPRIRAMATSPCGGVLFEQFKLRASAPK